MRSTKTFFSFFLFYSISTWAHPSPDSIPGLQKPQNSINFIVVGDWGQQANYHQKKVASVMGEAGKQLDINFIITTGDNFYPAGVTSVRDAQWKHTYEEVYTAISLQCPWYPTLGNHDYTLNPDAEVAYSKVSQRWQMPDRYYAISKRVGNDSLLMIFLDSEPIEKQLRGIAMDNSKIPGNYFDRQMEWFQNTLKYSHAKYKIVSAHHPLHTGGARRHSPRIRKMRRLIAPILQQYKVDIYFSGHEHQLEYLKPPGKTHYFISGAGSETRFMGYLKRFRKFCARKTRGFATVSVNDSGYLVQFVSDDSKVRYRKRIEK